MIACVDAAYGANSAAAACVIGAGWTSVLALRERWIRRAAPAEYEPGAFYKRELPLLLEVLREAAPIPEVILVDGYVWLDATGRPGLGAHLHEALGGAHAVVGVAKTAFGDAAAFSGAVLRGKSARPLFVTAVGMKQEDAADAVTRMHGAHRLPTLIRRADALARQAL
jgi:deoxyribonuclease V